ncbi:MAG TPA: protein-glutamate O-methyltransferase CheR [Acidimicrobiales bacterium]|nr:protein-glutamate O-methyltransferase CheR [Acidimicrobiales bacterium]
MSVTAEDFTFIADFLRRQSAISIAEGKEYLVESRLAPVARAAGMADVSELIGQLRKPSADPRVREQVVEAMTTNETSFFRDRHPFDALQTDIIPKLIEHKANGTKTINIWSAASSTGQEIYSIAMLLDAHFPELATWNVQLYGTDLSNDVLAKARSGRYSTLEVNRGLPAPMLARYFSREGADYVLDERIRHRCRFDRMNLAEAWPLLPTFDIVFCRNVLIYFDLEVRRSILDRIRQRLPEGGYLFLGTSETTVGLAEGYTATRCGNAVAYCVEGS